MKYIGILKLLHIELRFQAMDAIFTVSLAIVFINNPSASIQRRSF